MTNFAKNARWILCLTLALAVLTSVGCQGDRHTYERHVNDVQQDVETHVVVE